MRKLLLFVVEDIVFQFNVLALDGILFLKASREFRFVLGMDTLHEIRLLLFLDPADSPLFGGERLRQDIQ